MAVGAALGALIVYVRWRLDDATVESAIGLLAPFVIYLIAEQIHGSGVLAVVVAALILGQRSTTASPATRLQDEAVWKAVGPAHGGGGPGGVDLSVRVSAETSLGPDPGA